MELMGEGAQNGEPTMEIFLSESLRHTSCGPSCFIVPGLSTFVFGSRSGKRHLFWRDAGSADEGLGDSLASALGCGDGGKRKSRNRQKVAKGDLQHLQCPGWIKITRCHSSDETARRRICFTTHTTIQHVFFSGGRK